MKIGFYSPYHHILGGGERYVLTMASILSEKHEVNVFGDKQLQKKAEDFFGLDLSKVNFLPWVTSKSKRILKTREYDRFFSVTDGSIFISLAKKNFLIVQVPQKDMYLWNFANQIKLISWPNVLVYSNYVKNHIDQWWHTKAIVFPPAIDTDEFKTGKKENIILSVGRFFPLPHSKKQEVLIEVFRKLTKKKLNGWKLIFAGGLDSFGKKYFETIKTKTKGLNVEFHPNIGRRKLLNLYEKSKIYWHATGFGEDLEKHPERAEHFGITTLEAMASGCATMVFPAGGQKEIIEDNSDGLYWQSKKELEEKTIDLVNNISLWNRLSSRTRIKSKKYDIKVFQKRLEDLIK